MDDQNWLELLDIYQDMVEKQDEIIHRLGKIVAKQATELQLLRNDAEFSGEKIQEDMNIVKEVIDQYEDMKDELGP